MRRALALALWGTETRYVARAYLIRVIIVVFAVSAAVLALDVAGNFDQVMAASGRQPLPPGLGRVVVYLALRLAYDLPAILPLSVAIGIVWVEFTLARGHERAIICNTGRSPFLSLAPALLIGLLFGAGQFAALAVLRPMAVAAQGELGFRYYGPRLSAQGPERRWIVMRDAVLQAQISFRDDRAVLGDVQLFALGPDGRLRAAARAARGWLDGDRLVLDAPRQWLADPGATAMPRVDPVWLRNIGIEPRFLPQADLTRLARGGPGVPEAEAYRAVAQDRLAAGPRLLAVALLMATLSLALMRPRMAMGPALRIAAMGYGVHVLLQLLSTLGGSGYLPAALAFWAVPGGVIALCIAFNLRRERAVARAMARVRDG